ncbi:membrane transport protein-domain-containing protein [Naematelia encephala]|uniref:Membrane transport protein-domain-containing protein n=1 Tax=Naematelia encephala TaxID=71784 RepID=A0A1Y2ARY8_9TREE|nr:membrane transport protein-domain-containing protein [Naematelia encephala]
MQDSTEVPIRTLLVTVFESIIEVFLLCLAGYILSRAGVTDKATQRKLNVINVSLFTPALLFSKVAFSLTPAKLKEMWIIPLGFVIVTGLSAAVAWALSRALKLKRSQTAFAICAAMFQNSNSLPIALIQSLVIEVPHLKWGEDDTKDQMIGRALAYLVLYSTLGMMLRWSWGVKLLSHADDEAPDVEAAPPPLPAMPQAYLSVQSPEALEPHPGARETDPFFATAHALSQDEIDESHNPSRSMSAHTNSRQRSPSPASFQWTGGPGSAHSMHPPGVVRRGSSQSSHTGTRRPPTRTESGREFWGLPEAPRRQKAIMEEEFGEDSSDEEEEEEEWGGTEASPSLRRRATRPPGTRAGAILETVRTRTKAILKSINAFMTVPMYAALLSIFIALIPPLQAKISQLKPFEQAVRSAGQCSIPVTLVVLGAFFYTPAQSTSGPITLPHDDHPSSPSDTSHNSIGGYFERKLRLLTHRAGGGNSPQPNAYPGENKTVFVAVVSRMIIVPLILLPFIALLAKFDLFEAAEDPVFILSAVLLVSSPPALTLAQITQAASGDAFERLISKTISWSYAVLTPPLTLVYVVIGLMFGRL